MTEKVKNESNSSSSSCDKDKVAFKTSEAVPDEEVDVEVVLKRPKDPMASVIGEFGKWQFQKSLIVFFVGIPGLAHIFSSVFVAAKVDYWCVEDVPTGVDPLTANISRNKEACREDCNEYEFDHSFWERTIIMEWDLLCEDSDLSGVLLLLQIFFFFDFDIS